MSKHGVTNLAGTSGRMATVAIKAGGTVWHSIPVESLLAQLGSSPNGLSAQEAARRLAANGPNELKEAKPISPLAILLGQFKSLIVWILIVAAGISGALGEIVDAVAILAIVALNAAIVSVRLPSTAIDSESN